MVPIVWGTPKAVREEQGRLIPAEPAAPEALGGGKCLETQTLPQRLPKAPGRVGRLRRVSAALRARPRPGPAPGTRWGDAVTPSVTPAARLGDRAPLALGTARRAHSPSGCGRAGAGCGVTPAFVTPVSPRVSPASSLAVLWEQTQPIPAVLNPRGARVDGRRRRLFQPVWISHPERASRNPSQRRELPDYLCCCCESGLGSSLVLPAWRQGIVISGGRGRQVLPKSLHFPAPVLLSRIEGTPGTPSAHPQGCREMSPGANQPALPQEGSPLPH